MPWRPAGIPGSEQASHVLNQFVRETSGRIDSLTNQVSTKANSPIQQTSILAFGSLGGSSTNTAQVSVIGAKTANAVTVSPSQNPGSGSLVWSAWVPIPGTVEVRVSNPTNATVQVNTIPWNIVVHQ
jgi:hypothetical protein